MPVRAIVFDLFDTLVDLLMENIPHGEFEGRPVPGTLRDLHEVYARQHPVDFASFARTLAEVDREFLDTHYSRQRELPTRERFAALVARLGVADAGLARRLGDLHLLRVCEQVRLVEHHPALLGRLREQVRLGLCSNFSDSETAMVVLEQAGLASYLDAVVISEELGIRKPRPEIFEVVLRRLGVGPEATLHVGDNLRADVAGAAAVGLRTVWITRRVPDPQRSLAAYDGPRPDFQLRDLGELTTLLRTLQSVSG